MQVLFRQKLMHSLQTAQILPVTQELPPVVEAPVETPIDAEKQSETVASVPVEDSAAEIDILSMLASLGPSVSAPAVPKPKKAASKPKTSEGGEKKVRANKPKTAEVEGAADE